jgi:aryl-alcohol dehydrogenase-like predicted oxidoreductase
LASAEHRSAIFFASCPIVGRILEASVDAPSDQHGYVDTPAYVQRYDYTGDGFHRSLEDSLARLALTRVDLVYVHDIAPTDTLLGVFPRRIAMPSAAATRSDSMR